MKKKIPPDKIARIKIIKSAIYVKGVHVPCKDKEGNPLYSMFLLKEADLWEWSKDEDIDDATFETAYSGYYFSRSVYDQAAIDYLLTLNPNIIVF